MKKFHRFAFSFLSAMAFTPAYSISPNAFVSGAPLINPFTKSQTDVWKLVGYTTYSNGFCSAVQISPQWVLSTAHCSLEDGVVFRNGLSIDSRGSSFDCVEGILPPYGDHRFGDYSLCRLSNPERFTQLVEYPPIIRKDADYMNFYNRFGSVLDVGFSGGTAISANFGFPRGSACTLSCAPTIFFDGSFQDKEATFSNYLGLSGGDSGGGEFWFPPNENRPALIDLISAGGELPTAWITSLISNRGDIPPRVVTVAEHWRKPLQTWPTSLGTPPVLQVSQGGIVNAKWQQPVLVAGQQIDHFVVAEGVPGTMPQQAIVGNLTNNYTFTGISQSTTRRLCVSPENDGYENVSNANCTDYDPVVPSISGVGVKKITGSSALKAITFDWGFTGKPAIFKVTSVIKYPAGTSRTTVANLSTNTFILNASSKSQACISVVPQTNWATGTGVTKCVVVP